MEGIFVLPHTDSIRTQPREIAPDFMLRSVDGVVVRLWQMRDRPVVLCFFAAEGVMSRAQMAALNQVAAWGMASVVGIAEAGIPALREFAREKRVRFPLLSEPYEVVRKHYGVISLPSMVYIDAEGRIAAGQAGIVSIETMVEWLTWL